MSKLQVEKGDGGYLIMMSAGSEIKVVLTFSEVVQFLARYFNEKKICEDWKP